MKEFDMSLANGAKHRWPATSKTNQASLHPFLVALLVLLVAMRANAAPSLALLVAKHLREERGKSFPFNGNEHHVAEHL
jgi:hypothetical protein